MIRTKKTEVEGANPKKSAVVTQGELLQRADKLVKSYVSPN